MRTVNVGLVDAAVRWALAIALGVLSITAGLHPLLSLAIAMFALGIAASALTRYCPLYTWCGISSRHPTRPAHRS